MTTIHDLPTPALVLDLDRVERNVEWMAARAHRWGVRLRPHIKTHKCVELGRLQAHAGDDAITVSTLNEARTFADHGFHDLTWAFPVILSRIDDCRDLAERITLRLVVDSAAAVDALEASGFPFHVFLKVDCGYHRAGVEPSSPLAPRLAERLAGSPTLRFDGLLTHSGHAYQAGSTAEIRRIGAEECQVTVSFAERLRKRGLEVPEISVGSTPALSVARRVPGATEIRPGNYVFFDYSQVAMGACRPADCAVTVVASVVSARRVADQAVVDAGALALSKDAGPAAASTMGEIFHDYRASRLSRVLRLTSLSQEHGILSRYLPVGRRVRILPNHSCLAVACFDEYVVARGDEVIDRWKIWRGRD